MSLSNFRSYQLSIRFHRKCQNTQMAGYLKNQLLRAASSVALNLAEGSARPSERDRKKFYSIAFASLRECQAALDLSEGVCAELIQMADQLGGCLYKLCRHRGEPS